MRKLILLCGKSGCGKTITLKLLAEKLLTAGAEIKECTKKSLSTAEALSEDIQKSSTAKSTGDVGYVFLLHDVLIGIRTAGDTVGTVWDAVTSFEAFPCDIGVAACHPEHLVRSRLCLIAPWKSYSVHCKSKALSAASRDIENRRMAELLFQEIVQAVKEITPLAKI